MVMNLLSKKISDVPLGVVALLSTIGILLGVHLVCNCMKPIEGLSMLGAPLDYNMKDGVINVWRAKQKDSWTSKDWFSSLQGNVGGEVPLPEGQLAMYYANKFSGDCCPSFYSSSMGCLCESEKQAKYLNERGGNRTLTSMY